MGILSPRFWVQTIVATLFTMVMIYFIKKVSAKYNIPVVNQIAEGV